MAIRRLEDDEKGLLRYLFEFGASSEYRLDEYHFRTKIIQRMKEGGLIEFNKTRRTYKLTAAGRKRAESMWPWIKKTKSQKEGSPWTLKRRLREWIKTNLNQKLVAGSALFGCGDHGCAFKLKNDKVLKITSDQLEIECAKAIREQQEADDIVQPYGYPLPLVYQAGFVDIHSPLIPTYKGSLIARGYYIREKLEDVTLEDLIGGKRSKHITAFRSSRGRKPHGSWELWKENEKEVKEVLTALANKVTDQTGFELWDYELDENWGKRKLPDGSYEIVYRDLVCIV